MHRLLLNSPAAVLIGAISVGAGLRGQGVAAPNPGGSGEAALVAPLMQPGEAKAAPGGWMLR